MHTVQHILTYAGRLECTDMGQRHKTVCMPCREYPPIRTSRGACTTVSVRVQDHLVVGIRLYALYEPVQS